MTNKQKHTPPVSKYNKNDKNNLHLSQTRKKSNTAALYWMSSLPGKNVSDTF